MRPQDMKHYHCKLGLAVLAVVGVLFMPIGYIEVRNYVSCMELGELIGHPTQYLIGDTCYIRSDNEWHAKATFREPK